MIYDKTNVLIAIQNSNLVLYYLIVRDILNICEMIFKK